MGAIGIDIGGTNIRAALVDVEGRILAHCSAPSSSDPATVLERTAELAEAVGMAEAEAVGIGVPCRVDVKGRRVFSGGYIDFSGHDPFQELEARLNRPVTIENDCSMALLGEAHCGAAKGMRDVVMLTIGTGIGGAVLAGGELLRGRFAAGQLGHLVVKPSGARCLCGRRGCVETVSSGTALGKLIAGAGLSGTRVGELLSRAKGGETAAAALLARWATPLSAAIGSLLATLDPERVVLGGGLGAAAVEALALLPEETSWFGAPVVPATLGDNAGVIGAAMAALRSRTTRGKRAVLVNGVPASGKSHVANLLSRATGWPVLRLDSIKNPFLAELGGADRALNRTLGRASYAAIFETLRDAPDGTVAIIDAWFGFQPVDVLESHLKHAGVTTYTEIWCHAPAQTIADRYRARLGERPKGHPGAEYVPELIALAGTADALRLSPVFAIDTAQAVDIEPVRDWLDALWKGLPQ
ncbi:ROK family protein [Chelativorans sp. AA-79]|uniref:ROK family protein n=1 Tax=Chelativorans sp. AA-79 TaxID=3028735 RepID=UPI0023F8AEFC|nr:ROK family protein [Chelativorans sp. AA-79]WEX10602.1 ROK family protein [Chelativorans sp. AA-79]